jgi:hypothetical protein
MTRTQSEPSWVSSTMPSKECPCTSRTSHRRQNGGHQPGTGTNRFGGGHGACCSSDIPGTCGRCCRNLKTHRATAGGQRNVRKPGRIIRFLSRRPAPQPEMSTLWRPARAKPMISSSSSGSSPDEFVASTPRSVPWRSANRATQKCADNMPRVLGPEAVHEMRLSRPPPAFNRVIDSAGSAERRPLSFRKDFVV